jgi:hypothetical protein
MEAPTIRTFTLARIVALLLIAAAVAGLAYLRFAPDAEAACGPDARSSLLKPAPVAALATAAAV